MSHTATVQTEIKDLRAIKDACKRLGLEAPTQGEHRLFSSSHKGTAVKLKGWQYPVIFDATGKAHHDNYGGTWGNPAEFSKFKQAYGVAAAKRAARKKFTRVREVLRSDGSIDLICE